MRNYSNTALDTTLIGDITALAGGLTVADATGWPTPPFAAVIDPGIAALEEVVQVTGAVNTTWTITRGFDGTPATAHIATAVVRHAAIAADFTDLQAVGTNNTSAIAAHIALTDTAHGGLIVVTNVKSYGAVGNGVTDDAAAITAAAAAAGAGGFVYFPPGSYGTNSSLSPLTGQTWAGLNNQASIIKELGAFAGSNGLIYVNSANNAQVRDLGFTGNATNRQPSVVISGSTDVLLDRLYSDSTTTRLAIAQSSSHRCRVSHCICAGTTTSNAIEFNGSNYCSAENCTLQNAAGQGIEIYQNGVSTPIIGCRVIGCIIDTAGGSGIACFGDKDTQIIGNTIINCVSYGIYATVGEIDATVPSLYGTVSSNTLRSNGGTTLSGISLLNALTNNWTISGNTIEASGLAGLVSNGPNHTIVGNTISLSRNSGISLQNGAVGCMIVGNICVDNNIAAGSAVGIALASGATNNTLASNRCYDSRTGGSKTQQWAIQLAAGANYNFLYGNIGHGNVFGNISDLATGNDSFANGGGNAGVVTRTLYKALGAQTISNVQTTVAHGLGYTPTQVLVTMTGAGTIWKSAASDGTNVYLTADSVGRTGEVYVR